MRVLALGDIHGRINAVKSVLKEVGPVDVILLAGDITHFGTPEHAEKIIATIRELSTARILAVAGNCDSPEISAKLLKMGVSLHGRGEIVDGIGFHGCDAIPTWLDNMYQMTEEELNDALLAGHQQVALAPCRILLTHVPPYQCKVDRSLVGTHCGSKSLRYFIEQYQPHVHVCGHIHEARGVDRLGSTLVVNPGPGTRRNYALLDVQLDQHQVPAGQSQQAVCAPPRIQVELSG